jgi:hypothetical protein
VKTITILALLLCFGCATPPTPPNSVQMTLDILNHKPVDVEKIYADYAQARAEYEQTASYKSIPYLVAPLLILGGAANGLPLGPASAAYGVYSPGGLHGPGKVTINSTPTVGGGYRTTIDPMY